VTSWDRITNQQYMWQLYLIIRLVNLQ